jgi:hypothetical protein
VRIAIVPHEVPVAKETMAATRNTATGSMAMGRLEPIADFRNPAVSRSVHTWPRDHARVSTTKAMNMLLNPLTVAAIACRMLRMP